MFDGWCGRCGMTYGDVEDWLARGHGRHVCIARPVELDAARAERAAWRAILDEEDQRRHPKAGRRARGEWTG